MPGLDDSPVSLTQMAHLLVGLLVRAVGLSLAGAGLLLGAADLLL